jgi:hypothetical protein
VDAGIFHDFHHEWISRIKRALNAGLLPPWYYAIAEQTADTLIFDFRSTRALDRERYASKQSRIAVRHENGDQLVGAVEIVSPGNKSNRHGLRAFVEKAAELLETGTHLLLVDLFPPGPRDPDGIHAAIWSRIGESDFRLPPDLPLTLASYSAGELKRAFVEPVAVGRPLPEMPLFLEPDLYTLVPLEPTYMDAFAAVPKRWRDELET